MKQQIKFRGKRLDGVWAYGTNIYIPIKDKWKTRINGSRVDPDTIGQFTGLRDRNGKEIYKGDILIYIDKEANEHYREVVYHLGCFKFHNPNAKLPDTPIYHHLVDGGLNWEVIGNIHGSPELIKR